MHAVQKIKFIRILSLRLYFLNLRSFKVLPELKRMRNTALLTETKANLLFNMLFQSNMVEALTLNS